MAPLQLKRFKVGNSGICPSVAEPEKSVAKLPNSLTHPVQHLPYSLDK
jgi:hypothetical protein